MGPARVLTVCCALGALAAACSSGGGKPSATATTRSSVRASPTTTSVRVYPTVAGQPSAGVGLGPCPKTFANTSLTKLNAGVAGLDTQLVPIAATKVRTCRWNSGGRLNDGGFLSAESLGKFVDETNRLPKSSSAAPRRAHPRDSLIASQPIYVTFATDSQQVTVRFDALGAVTNGVLSVEPTCGWETYFLAVSCAPTTPR